MQTERVDPAARRHDRRVGIGDLDRGARRASVLALRAGDGERIERPVARHQKTKGVGHFEISPQQVSVHPAAGREKPPQPNFVFNAVESPLNFRQAVEHACQRREWRTAAAVGRREGRNLRSARLSSIARIIAFSRSRGARRRGFARSRGFRRPTSARPSNALAKTPNAAPFGPASFRRSRGFAAPPRLRGSRPPDPIERRGHARYAIGGMGLAIAKPIKIDARSDAGRASSALTNAADEPRGRAPSPDNFFL